MQIYLVGGAVRDELLGIPVHDHDYVVVGATPEQMHADGFIPIGRDFPVFLHPISKAEYALARSEKKISMGYRGFEFFTSPSVSLVDDLKRRDLTINAMAKDDHTGEIIDPYHGQDDLKQRMLRHVSDAFGEDPLRILRVARFAAQLAPFGFTIAPETLMLMHQMSQTDELKTLSAERVWQETEKALMTSSASTYFSVLRECGALAQLFPEINNLFGVPQRAEYHPEIDSGIHTLMALDIACQIDAPAAVRWAVLIHDLGKGLTPKEEWPRHIAHEQRGLEPVKHICQRLKVPKLHEKLALAVCRDHLLMHQLTTLKAKTIYTLLKRLDARRNPEFARYFVIACQCDARGRLGMHDKAYPQAQLFNQFIELMNTPITVDTMLTGTQIAAFIDRQLIALIEQTLRDHQISDTN